MRVTTAAVALALCAGVAQAAPYGAITAFATVPAAPGFPEGVAVHDDRVFTSGPARFGTAGTGPSALHVFNRKTGGLEQTVHVAGEALAFEHALSNIAVDAKGRVYALSTQLGLIRFEKKGKGYVQESYGDPLPDLPKCVRLAPNPPCSPTGDDMPPLGNDIVFDRKGFAYVTDSLQATIFRYAPGGGAPQVWFQHPVLQGGGPIPFGPNGARLNPERTHLYFASSTNLAHPESGGIFRVPLIEAPTWADLQGFHEYNNSEIPDQLAFGARGDLYVSLALTNQISVLAPDGTEKARISSAPGDAIPLDAPAGIAFDTKSKSLLIANHALLSGNAANFAVLSTYVADPGDPLEKPKLP